MGLTDEHWCSDCGNYLDKRKDEYIEMNFNNWKNGFVFYHLMHKPTNKSIRRFPTHKEATFYIENLSKSKLKDKDPANYEIKVFALKIKKKIANVARQHDRVFLCKNCYASQMMNIVERLRDAGNPIFHCSIICWDWKECAFYEPPDQPPIPMTATPCESANLGEPEKYQEANCKNVACIDDVVYCRRRHPGAVVLAVEETMIQERRLKESPIYMREIVDKMMKTICDNTNRNAYISCFPEGPIRDQKALEFDASLKMVANLLNHQMTEVKADPGSPFFMTKAGDQMLYVEICENKVLVADPDKKKAKTEEETAQ